MNWSELIEQTPIEKANELANAMFKGSVFDYKGKEELRAEQNRAKQCALIAIQEVIETMTKIKFYSELNFLQELKYWQEVKQEIERM